MYGLPLLVVWLAMLLGAVVRATGHLRRGPVLAWTLTGGIWPAAAVAAAVQQTYGLSESSVAVGVAAGMILLPVGFWVGLGLGRCLHGDALDRAWSQRGALMGLSVALGLTLTPVCEPPATLAGMLADGALVYGLTANLGLPVARWLRADRRQMVRF